MMGKISNIAQAKEYNSKYEINNAYSYDLTTRHLMSSNELNQIPMRPTGISFCDLDDRLQPDTAASTHTYGVINSASFERRTKGRVVRLTKNNVTRLANKLRIFYKYAFRLPTLADELYALVRFTYLFLFF